MVVTLYGKVGQSTVTAFLVATNSKVEEEKHVRLRPRRFVEQATATVIESPLIVYRMVASLRTSALNSLEEPRNQVPRSLLIAGIRYVIREYLLVPALEALSNPADPLIYIVGVYALPEVDQ